MRSRTWGLSSCGTWALVTPSMWNRPRPGMKPMLPALVADSQPLDYQESPNIFFKASAAAIGYWPHQIPDS